MELGLDVLVEKPLALSLAEARDVIDRAERLGRVVMVDHTFLHSDLTSIARNLSRSGAVGKIRRITSRRLAPGKRRPDIDALWNLAPHDIALILNLGRGKARTVQGEPSFIQGEGNAVEFRGTITHDTDLVGEFHVSCNSPERVRDLRLEGESGSIVVDYIARTIAVTNRGSRIAWRAEEREPLARVVEAFADRVVRRNIDENHRAIDVVRLLDSLTNEGRDIPYAERGPGLAYPSASKSTSMPSGEVRSR
ncbi:hypothetical protein GCM10027059_44550 [Myceligenerans halotolerans]